MDCCQFKREVELLLHSISSKYGSILKAFYEPYGITAVQATVLLALYRRGPGKISDMAELLGMTNSNLSVICRRLEKGGFLLRKREDADRRTVYLHLTHHCLSIMAELEKKITSEYLCPLEAAAEEERILILQGMQALDRLVSPTLLPEEAEAAHEILPDKKLWPTKQESPGNDGR